MRKVEELKDCVGITCDGFGKQFKALIITIEVGQPSLTKSIARKERELKKLSYSINYNNKSAFCGKGKNRAVIYSP